MSSNKDSRDIPENAPLDFNLDIPDLQIEELSIEVDTVKANISVKANVKELVSISVGTNIELDTLKLDMKGVDAKAKLEVYLGNIKEIILKACETVIEETNLKQKGSNIIDDLNPLKKK